MRWEVQSALIGALGIVLSATVSALAVIATQRFADKKHATEQALARSAEEGRRQLDRDAEVQRLQAADEMEQRAYERQLTEWWRESRREAHIRLFRAFDAMWLACSIYTSGPLADLADEDSPPAVGDTVVPDAVWDEVGAAYATVQLVADEPARGFANDMWRSIWWVGKYAPYGVGTVKQVREYQARYLAAFASYTAAARTELQVSAKPHRKAPSPTPSA